MEAGEGSFKMSEVVKEGVYVSDLTIPHFPVLEKKLGRARRKLRAEVM